MPLPGKRRRTIASATTTPNTVFSGTAIATAVSVIWNACSVSVVVSASHAASTPFSNVRQKTIVSGPIRIAAR
jgi:hypothetical protein